MESCEFLVISGGNSEVPFVLAEDFLRMNKFSIIANPGILQRRTKEGNIYIWCQKNGRQSTI